MRTQGRAQGTETRCQAEPREHFMIDPLLGESTVLVTGAKHGIGAASARAFAAQGAGVFLHYYRVPTEWSGDALVRLFDRCEETLGPVDIRLRTDSISPSLVLNAEREQRGFTRLV